VSFYHGQNPRIVERYPDKNLKRQAKFKESAEIFQPAGDYILQTEVTSLSEDEIDAILDNLN